MTNKRQRFSRSVPRRKRFERLCVSLILLIVTIVGIRIASTSGASVVEIPPLLSESGPSTFRIVIDPGHGGKDPGATGSSGAFEKEYNLAMAQRVYQLLKQDPMFEVKMTREDDHFVELEERAAIANEWNADALISIHGNTYEDPAVSGTETLYYHNESIPLARTLQKEITAVLGLRDRGIKQQQLVILSRSEVPAVIVEMGYLTNPGEEELLLSSDGQALGATAIYEGLKNYFSH